MGLCGTIFHFWCPVLERGEWRPKIKFQFSSVQFSPSKSGLMNKHIVKHIGFAHREIHVVKPIVSKELQKIRLDDKSSVRSERRIPCLFSVPCSVMKENI